VNDLNTDPDLTLAERAALLLRHDILTGRHAPGERLGVVELAQNLGMGSTPVREGLSRLVSQGLVVSIGRRGFRVSDTSREDLEDLTLLRRLIELEALRRSLERGGDDWEAGIVAALHRLKAFVRREGLQAPEGHPDYDALHKAFHLALISACEAPRLLATAIELYDQAYRYRRLMMTELKDPDHFIRVHEDLAEVALSRDRLRAEQLLGDHLETTLAYVYAQAG